ncbi:hypothetical protein BZG36_00235 [Bifiguratus adelaidae]|uniref:Tr-type G domain-containing protein n=1 Tax=Bifiguratus adelaidae TaxID=1938954 RepID=A0A261Y8E2_9FUNG|nr:hypothetical protein BZG36_00235 [Bifiguratus adelaidae]
MHAANSYLPKPALMMQLHRCSATKANDGENSWKMSEFTQDRIRNFSIIAHIDHGKSTLADRLLELTGTIKERADNKQVLDKLVVERERGITVKAQTVSMFFEHYGQRYLLNLIDTPMHKDRNVKLGTRFKGHVDFSYEVSRSLAATQGCLLLVDAAQGVQAQTVANFHLAKKQGLKIIPVLNKIDLHGAEIHRVASEVKSLGMAREPLQISAKTRLNIEQILPAVIEYIPPPTGSRTSPFRSLLFDSWYDKYKGVICLMSIKDGVLRQGDKIQSVHSGQKYDVTELGIMHPEQTPTKQLYAGQVGYVVCSMRSASEAKVGDTFARVGSRVEPLPGFEAAKAMVYAGIFPVDTNDFQKLDESIKKLTLNDSSVSVSKETSTALGQGWRLGFLGTLHMDVFRQRLEQEYEANIIVTQPTVPYKVIRKGGNVKYIRNPIEFPSLDDTSRSVAELQEPMVLATMVFPEEYLGSLMDLCGARRGEQVDYGYLDETRVLMKYRLPLAEVVTDFFDELKSRSSGYATFDYEEDGYQKSDLVKMSVLLNSKPVDALSVILHRSQVEFVGRDWVKRLKNVIQRQLFEIIIQTTVGNKVIARETIPPMRKDVTAKLYGGDVTRKMKLLEKQKAGKKRMKKIGNVELPQSAFYDFMGSKTSR